MTPEQAAEPRLRALPVQLISMRSAVILRRGDTEVRIDGERAKEAVEAILVAASGVGATAEELCARFAAPDRPAIERLLHELRTRRLLVRADDPAPASGEYGDRPGLDNGTESRLDVFYWHFGQRAAEVACSLSSRQIALVGVNAVSRRLVSALAAVGATNIEIVDYPPLRNVELAGELAMAENGQGLPDTPIVDEKWLDRADLGAVHCVIATSDFGAPHALRLWNQFCVERRMPFLPVSQHNLLGSVGPLVMPGETPCYECLRARGNSHLHDHATHRAIEEAAFSGQRFTALHPSAVTVLAELAAVELSKWFGGARPPTRQVGTLVEVNVAEPYVVARKVLRIPHCPVCSPGNRHTASAIRIGAFNP